MTILYLTNAMQRELFSPFTSKTKEWYTVKMLVITALKKERKEKK